MGPRHLSRVAGVLSQRHGSLPGRLGSLALAHVVLEAPHQQGHRAGDREHLPVLTERGPAGEQCGDAAEPELTLCPQGCRGPVRVLAAEPVGGDAYGVERGTRDVGGTKPRDDPEGVHTGSCKQVGLSSRARIGRKERAGHGAEREGDQRLVEGVGLRVTGLPPLPVAQEGLASSCFAVRMGLQHGDGLGLRPAPRQPLGAHALSPDRSIQLVDHAREYYPDPTRSGRQAQAVTRVTPVPGRFGRAE